MAVEPAPEPSDSPRRVDPQAALQGAAGTDLARIQPGRSWAWPWPGPRPTAPAPDARQALLHAGVPLDTGASFDVPPVAWVDATHVPGADVAGAFLAAPVGANGPADAAFLAGRNQRPRGLRQQAGALLWAARPARPDLTHAVAQATRTWFAARGVQGLGSAPTLRRQALLRGVHGRCP